MAYGRITKIEADPNAGGLMFGSLTDLDTGAQFSFQKQDIPTVTRQDIVNYTAQGSEAMDLTPNLAVKFHELQTASPDVQTAAAALVKAMAKDKNMTDVVAKKF